MKIDLDKRGGSLTLKPMVFNTEKKRDELLSKNYNENAKNIKWDDIKRSKKPYELLGKIQELSARNTLLYIKQQQEKMTKEIKLETQELEKSKIEETKAQKEVDEVKDAVKFTADFYKEVFKVYGEKAEKLAKEFEKQAKGKKIRNANDALKAYEKHKANINKKINAKDRKAIATALESVKVADIAKNFKRFSKGMGYTSYAIDFSDWLTELHKATQTDNWRPFFVKTETIAAGMVATAVVGFAFSFLLGGPVGLLGYGLIMAGVGALIDDKLIEDANKLIGI
ncbi:colicin transporter [Salmonella enterica subsp. enterica serovar Enteritidis]|nr:colicin transporter [Salmonella enterica subsp. enterica serovar Enteritidis]